MKDFVKQMGVHFLISLGINHSLNAYKAFAKWKMNGTS